MYSMYDPCAAHPPHCPRLDSALAWEITPVDKGTKETEESGWRVVQKFIIFKLILKSCRAEKSPRLTSCKMQQDSNAEGGSYPNIFCLCIIADKNDCMTTGRKHRQRIGRSLSVKADSQVLRAVVSTAQSSVKAVTGVTKWLSRNLRGTSPKCEKHRG